MKPEPRTATSRRILGQDYRGNECYPVTREDLIDIEAEAAALTPAPKPNYAKRGRCGLCNKWHDDDPRFYDHDWIA